MNAPLYSFTGPYQNCYHEPLNSMDQRHVGIVHGVLMTKKFHNALELGSWRGASSTAFIEAINAHRLDQVTFCDLTIQDSLLDVISACDYPGRVRVTTEYSWDVLESGEDYDFVLVDASHDIESVGKELVRLVIRKPLVVMAHDTSATAAGYESCEGAQLLKEVFQNMAGYRCLEDSAIRPGERTERGLFLATKDATVYEHSREVFDRFAKD